MNLAIKRAAVVALSTGAVLVAGAAPAAAAEPVTVSTDAPATWTGAGDGVTLLYADGITPCDGSPIGMCDSTVVTVAPRPEDDPNTGSRTLTVTMTPTYEDNDFDLYVYPDTNADGVADGEAIDDGAGNTGLFVGEAETLSVPDAAGSYLVEIVYFLAIGGEFTATASLAEATAGGAAARSNATSFHNAQVAGVRSALAAARK